LLYRKSYSFAALDEQLQKVWLQLIQNAITSANNGDTGAIFGGTVDSAVEKGDFIVPEVVYHCVEFIKKDGLKVEGNSSSNVDVWIVGRTFNESLRHVARCVSCPRKC
jgi:hypothetical protein